VVVVVVVVAVVVAVVVVVVLVVVVVVVVVMVVAAAVVVVVVEVVSIRAQRAHRTTLYYAPSHDDVNTAQNTLLCTITRRREHGPVHSMTD
jgi:hypothetical protein